MAQPQQPGDSPLFLLGLMGAGKTTVGRRLAARLGCAYYDNDALLLSTSGSTLVALAGAGAGVLHDSESEQVRGLVAKPGRFVASVAASVAERPDDLALLGARGTLVYLRSQPHTLAARLGSGEGRPWFEGNPGPVLARMFSSRDAVYCDAADIVVECDNLTPRVIAGRVYAAMTGAVTAVPPGASDERSTRRQP